MPTRAKLFRTGGSQAVRLPKEFRFDGEKDVLIYRVGSRVVLEGRRGAWSSDFLALGGSAPDFPARVARIRSERGPELD